MTKYKYRYNKTLVARAQFNKKEATDAEKSLWRHLRSRILDGHKFRRQYPVINYILDFYCVKAKLAVELDGGQHMKNKRYDKARTVRLTSLGIKVIRFWDSDVLKNVNGVLEKILSELENLS